MKDLIAISMFFALLLMFASCKDGKTVEKTSSKDVETNSLSQEETDHYLKTGKMIALSTFEALSSNLKKALSEGGVAEAAKYCNIVAMPLTDSLAAVHQATIKRTSLKLRNPENAPNEQEMKILVALQDQFDNKEDLKPRVIQTSEGIVNFYAPIMTKQLCLSCHGTIGQELTNDNYSILKDLYPKDQAIGYEENELRGMWSIELKESL